MEKEEVTDMLLAETKFTISARGGKNLAVKVGEDELNLSGIKGIQINFISDLNEINGTTFYTT